MAHSDKCFSDLTTRWNGTHCVLCITSVPPGYGVTPNCGFSDDGSWHEPSTKPCKSRQTFNDGSSAFCASCSACPQGAAELAACSPTRDTVCSRHGSASPTVPVTSVLPSQEPQRSTTPPPAPPVMKNHLPVFWALSSVVLVCLVLAAAAVYMKRKRGRRTAGSYNRRPSYVNQAYRNSDVEGILNQAILSAPLQTVLDNLDVLEEMVILLDPESRGIKNTKHLASLCSFPSTWITYTYSMRESKSPLRAVLEGVTSRNPEWTVDHLARLLKRMGRNDAIAALAKLRVDDSNV